MTTDLPGRSHDSSSRNVSLPGTSFILLKEAGDWLDPGSATLLTHSVPQFPQLQNVDNSSNAFNKLLWGLPTVTF